MDKDDQLDFKLSTGKPVRITILSSITIGWLILHHPKILINSRISVEPYGMDGSVKFIVIPPTMEAMDKILEALEKSHATRNNYVRPSNKRDDKTGLTL